MTQTKKSKNRLILGSVFAILAITFALLYHFDVIKTFDLFLAVTYVVYFAGLALIYNGSYSKERGYKHSHAISTTMGLVFVLTSVVFLIYGFSTGIISFV